jgi:hypothetical protein
MKTLISTAILIFTVNIAISQNAPATAQPVPNATKTEKSAPTQKPEIILPTTEKPPIYPGAEVHAVETQRNLIFPASPPAPTQPAQTQPLTPIESTNTLNPTQPQREAASRENPVIELQSGASPVIAGNATVNPGAVRVLQNTSAPTASPAPVKAELSNTGTVTESSKATMAERLDGTVERKDIIVAPAGTAMKKGKAKAGVKKTKAGRDLP